MPNDVSDLRSTIVPKSDQLNSEQLLGGPITIVVTGVKLGSTDEQPIAVHYEGEAGRPYKPSKTQRKVLILAWGSDGRDWVGRSMTLFNDPTIKFGGEQVGGIRISHLSDIERDIQVSLTATKGKKALHVIKRMATPVQAERPPRTQRHDSMVADFAVLAREQGLDAFREAWERASKEDKTAIGRGERDRLIALGQAHDESTTNKETTE